MRVLVTGASGQVGWVAAEHLIAAGHEVVTVSRRVPRLPGEHRALMLDLGCAGTLLSLRDTVERCDAIVHAAAALDRDPRARALSVVNGAGTQDLLALAEDWGGARFVFLSGVTVVGRPQSKPVTEDHPVRPESAYLATKLLGEQLVGLATEAGLPGVTLRLTAPVGPRTPAHRLLGVLVARALADESIELDGTGARGQDYVDVRDVAVAIDRALSSAATGTFNVAAGRTVSNRLLAQRCVAVLASRSKIERSGRPDPDDDLSWEVSTQRAREELGWSAETGLDDSIAAVAGEITRRRPR